MPRPPVNIPGVGPVNFPDSMSDDEVNAAAGKLYDQAKAAGPTPFQQQAAQRKAGIEAEQTAANTPPSYGERLSENLKSVAQSAFRTVQEKNPALFVAKAAGLPFQAAESFIAPAIEPVARHFGAEQPLAQAVGETGAMAATAFLPIPGIGKIESALGIGGEEAVARNLARSATKESGLVEDVGKVIEHNAPASPAAEADLTRVLEQKGVDTSQPQQVADHLAATEGIEPPVVKEVGVPISKTEGQDVSLETGIPSEVAHEVQHVKSDQLGLPQPPEDNELITREAIQKELPKYAGNINLNRIKTTDDVRQAIYAAGSQISRDPVPLADIKAAADDLNLSVDDILAHAADNRDLPARVVAARTINVQASEAYVAARDTWKADQSQSNFIAVRQAQATMLKTMAAASQEASTAGLTLGSFRIDAEGTLPADRALNSVKELLTQVETKGPISDEITRRLAATDLGDPAQRNKLVTFLATKGSSPLAKVQEYFVNSLLSGPPTHVLKAASDLTMTMFRPVVDGTAGLINAARSAITGAPQERFVGEAVADVQGFFNGLHDAWKSMADVYAGRSEEVLHGGRGAAIPGPIGDIVRLPVKNLSAITTFFQTLQSRASLYQQGFRNAMQDGLGHAEAMDRAYQAAQEPTVQMLDVANKDGMRWTFMANPGQFGLAVEKARNSTVFGKFVMPFIRVPMNIAKFGYESSALGLPQAIAKIAKGVPDADARAAQAVLGTALQVWVGSLVAAGRITGGGPKDPRAQDNMKSAGWQPYSIRAGDAWHSYLRIEPIGMVAGMAADATEIAGDLPRETASQLMSRVSVAAGKTILSKTYLQGLRTMIDAIEDPARYAEQFAGGLVGGFIPTLSAKIAQAGDPYLRATNSFVDQLKSRVPGLREQIPPKRDIMGQPIPAPGTPAERLLSPVLSSPVRGGKLQEDLVDVEAEIGRLPKVLTVQGHKIQLDDEDYDKYQQVAGANVSTLLNSAETRLSNLEPKERDYQSQAAARKTLLTKLVTLGREAGKRQFIGEMAKSGRLKTLLDESTQLERDRSMPNPYSRYTQVQSESSQ